VLATLIAIVLVALACGGGGGDDESAPPETSGDNEFTIWAPTSVQKPLDTIIQRFKNYQPDIQIDATYGSGAELNDRLLQGEKPDVYVGTAVEVQTLADEGTLPGDTVDFGADDIVMIVPPGNPKAISDLSVFGLDPLTTSGLCEQTTACGRGGRAVLANAGVSALPDVNDPAPKTLLSRVADGALDVALLYRTQAVRHRQKGLVDYVAIPTNQRNSVGYQIAMARPGEAVDKFTRYVETGGNTQKILAQAGLAPLEGDPQ
jgi:molybdate transport system substrate-binding protein